MENLIYLKTTTLRFELQNVANVTVRATFNRAYLNSFPLHFIVCWRVQDFPLEGKYHNLREETCPNPRVLVNRVARLGTLAKSGRSASFNSQKTVMARYRCKKIRHRSYF